MLDVHAAAELESRQPSNSTVLSGVWMHKHVHFRGPPLPPDVLVPEGNEALGRGETHALDQEGEALWR